MTFEQRLRASVEDAPEGELMEHLARAFGFDPTGAANRRYYDHFTHAPPQPDPDHARRIDRARKLLAVARSSTFEGEITAAYAAFDRHMARHDLSFEDVS